MARAAPLTALVLCLVAANAAAKGDIALSAPWVATPIALDGADGDWKGAPMTYLEESIRVVAATHDGSDLYLMFRFADERLARRIARFGVTLWLHGSSRSQEYGVRYAGSTAIADALGADPEGGPAIELPPDDPGREDGPSAPRPGTITVLRGDDSSNHPESSEYGPAAASGVTGDLYCYELRVPLAEIPGVTAAVEQALPETLSLGVQLDVPARGGRGAGDRGGSAFGPGGRGGRRGGPGRTREPGGAASRSAAPGPASAAPVWLTLELGRPPDAPAEGQDG